MTEPWARSLAGVVSSVKSGKLQRRSDSGFTFLPPLRTAQSERSEGIIKDNLVLAVSALLAARSTGPGRSPAPAALWPKRAPCRPRAGRQHFPKAQFFRVLRLQFSHARARARTRTHADGVPLRLGTELLGRAPWRFVAALCLHVGPQFSPGHPAWQRAGGLLCCWLRRRCRQAFSKCSRQPGETSGLGCLSPPGTKRASSAAVFFLGVLELFIKRSTPAQDNR